MVSRGRAVVKKDSKYRDGWFDLGGNEVSPPSSPEHKKENPGPKRKQKLSSEVLSPSGKGCQESPSREQSALKHEALAHLFDDLTNTTDAPVPSVEPNTTLPGAGLLFSSSVKYAQAIHQRAGESTTSSAPLARPQQKGLPKESHRAQLPTPDSHGTPSNSALSHPSSQAPSVQPFKQRADTDDMANNFIPTGQYRNMRACMVCSIVKTTQQFLNNGCPNCGFLELRGNQEAIADCTSQVFEGLITVSDTSKSWVARWQRLEGYVPGVYAVQVEGILPDDVINTAEENGVHYIPRDGSVNEALPTDA